MINQKRKSGKINNEIKRYALDNFYKGKRLTDISKDIGYSEPTIKYWVRRSDSILSTERSEVCTSDSHLSKTKAIKMYDDGQTCLGIIAKSCDMSITLVRQYINNRDDKPIQNIVNKLEDSVKNEVSFNYSFPSEPKLSKPDPQITSSRSIQDSSRCLTSDDQLTYLVRQFHDCKQDLQELQDFMKLGRRVVNRVANRLAEFEDTLNKYDSSKKVKREPLDYI